MWRSGWWESLCVVSSTVFLTRVLRKSPGGRRVEGMESMEPISAYYTTVYPEIYPGSAYGSKETSESQPKTPPAPVYDEDMVHKVGRFGYSIAFIE